MTKWEEYQKATRDFIEASEWNNLIKGRRYDSGSTFGVSVAHCEIKLVRAGQQYRGGQNYWDVPKALGVEILNLISSDPSILERAEKSLEQKAKQALIDCEDETKKRLVEIEAAKVSA